MPRLLRRREVWLPTWWGGLLIAGAVVLVASILGAYAYPLLAPTQPVPAARTLVVEGWLGQGELQQVAAVVRDGRYARVLTTGGPLEGWGDLGEWHSGATRAAAYLSSLGTLIVPVIAVPAPDVALDRTYVSARAVRDWGARTGTPLDAIDLLSVGVHTRRSWLVYRLAFGHRTEIGVIAVRPTGYDGERWWTSSAGVKATMGEVLSLAWTKCCFWPGGA